MVSDTLQNETTSGEAQPNSDYCLNCDERLKGRFCYVCGQKDIGQRLSGRLLLNNLFEAISDLDSRLWHTLIDLVKNPGRVAKAYIGGARARYINPIQFFLATMAVYLGFLAMVGWLDIDSVDTSNISFDDVDGDISAELERWVIKFVQSIKMVIAEQRNILLVGVAPVFALLLKWLFRKAHRNFAESLTLVCFMLGQTQLYDLTIALTEYALGYEYSGTEDLVTQAVLILGIRGFYETGWVKSIFAGIFAFILLGLVHGAVGASLAYLNILLS